MTLDLKQRPFQIIPSNLSEAMKLADMIAGSDLAPKDYKSKPGNVLIAMQMGAEVGLSPLQAIQNIAVINGRPCVWGDAAIGLVRSSQSCESIKEWIEGSIKDKTAIAYCEVKRRGESLHVSSFSVDDAVRAGLWNKTGPWQQYPERMLQMRARGFAIRDVFADVLKGLNFAEEAIDLPSDDYKIINTSQSKGVTGLKARLSAIKPEDSSEPEHIEIETNAVVNDDISPADEIKSMIRYSTTLNDLKMAKDMAIRSAKNLTESDQAEIKAMYKEQSKNLKSTLNQDSEDAI